MNIPQNLTCYHFSEARKIIPQPYLCFNKLAFYSVCTIFLITTHRLFIIYHDLKEVVKYTSISSVVNISDVVFSLKAEILNSIHVDGIPILNGTKRL